ncbi:MAG: hypothetical protein ACUVQW_04055 [Candidatus Bathycorpusculaceae bacterium]
MQLNAVDNYFTFPDRRPPKSRDNGEISEILGKNILLPYVHIADVCGAKIELKTNSKHVSRWWQLNWHICNSKPDGTVYVINGVEGYEPHLFYNVEKRRVLIVNSEYYGAAKSNGALGLASIILRESEKFPLHAAAVGFGRHETFCVAIIAPTGTGKTTQFHELLYNVKSSKVIGDDYLFASFNEDKGEVLVEQPEKQLYMRTEIAERHPTFIKAFDGLPLENVVVKKEDCRQKSENIQKMGPCYRLVFEERKRCIFDEGFDKCYWSYGNSRVMFPRERFTMLVADEKGDVQEVFKGKEGVADSALLKHVLLLTRDENSAIIRRIECEEALEILKEGRFQIAPGSGPPDKWGQYSYEPFYDPYQLEMDKNRQEQFFKKLFDYGILFYILNTGYHDRRKIEVHQTHAYIRAALRLNG